MAKSCGLGLPRRLWGIVFWTTGDEKIGVYKRSLQLLTCDWLCENGLTADDFYPCVRSIHVLNARVILPL